MHAWHCVLNHDRTRLYGTPSAPSAYSQRKAELRHLLIVMQTGSLTGHEADTSRVFHRLSHSRAYTTKPHMPCNPAKKRISLLSQALLHNKRLKLNPSKWQSTVVHPAQICTCRSTPCQLLLVAVRPVRATAYAQHAMQPFQSIALKESKQQVLDGTTRGSDLSKPCWYG